MDDLKNGKTSIFTHCQKMITFQFDRFPNMKQPKKNFMDKRSKEGSAKKSETSKNVTKENLSLIISKKDIRF